MKKYIKLTSTFLIFLSFFCLFFISGFYIYYIYKSPKPADKSHLLKYYPKDFILETGGKLKTPNSRFQHFLNFHSVKEKGTIRIGTFGDSHTFGFDVDQSETYPHQLQQLFDEQFPDKKIQILNFGVEGISFSEQFLIWKKYSRRYELDYILLGPRGFYPYRDVNFTNRWNDSPKIRFILLKDHLKKVQIKGKNLKEIFTNYYQLIPSRTAFHYERDPFKILNNFFPGLTLENNHYYTDISEEEEAAKISIILLNQIRKSYNKKILFFTDHGAYMFNRYQSVKDFYNLNQIQFKKLRFYETLHLHKSSLGNEIIANIYFNALIGRKKFSLKIINCVFQNNELTSKTPDKKLTSIQSAQILGGKMALSSFYYYPKWAKSSITFLNKSNLLESPVIFLPTQLKEGMKIYIQDADKNQMELSSIVPFDEYRKLFVFYGEYITNQPPYPYADFYKPFFLLDHLPHFIKNSIMENNTLELFVENYKLGHLKPYDLYGQKSLQFFPVNENVISITGLPHRIREKDFPSEFPLYIQYITNEGEKIKSLVPDWKCKKEKKEIHLELPNFQPLNLK